LKNREVFNRIAACAHYWQAAATVCVCSQLESLAAPPVQAGGFSPNQVNRNEATQPSVYTLLHDLRAREEQLSRQQTASVAADESPVEVAARLAWLEVLGAVTSPTFIDESERLREAFAPDSTLSGEDLRAPVPAPYGLLRGDDCKQVYKAATGEFWRVFRAEFEEVAAQISETANRLRFSTVMYSRVE
jgi:hypothetical protein